jgi:hypothetical protein
MAGTMTIVQQRHGAEKALEHMTLAIDVAGVDVRKNIHGDLP